MKALQVFIFIIFLLSCSVNRIREDVLYKTKFDVGYYLGQCPDHDGYMIATQHGVYHVDNKQPIPDSTRCWVKRIEIIRIGGEKYLKPYFTWDGTDTLIEIHYDIYTGEQKE